MLSLLGENGYSAIARQAEKRLKGIIVARTDSDISDLAQLGGQTLAFPSPGAFGASVLTRATLSAQDIAFTAAYVKSHDSVYRAVAAGLMPAGGGVLRTFNAVDPEIRAALQVIFETDAYTPHAIAVRSDIAGDVGGALQAALVAIASERPELIENIGMGGIQASVDADWDDVRGLEMTRAETGILSNADAQCPSD